MPSDLLDRLEAHRLERTLTVPPQRSGTESSLIATFCLLLGLSQGESRLFVRLVRQDHCTAPELHAALAPDGAPMSKNHAVPVVVCGARKKLAVYGIKIHTVYGAGYRLAPDARDRLRRLLAIHGEDVLAAAAAPTAAAKAEAAAPRKRAPAKPKAPIAAEPRV